MQLRIGTTVLTVESVYPYIYQYGEGKEVLRIKILKENHGYAAITAALEDPQDDIEQLEDGTVVNVYQHYTEDFKSAYANGEYEIELTRKGALAQKVEALEEQVTGLTAVNANLLLQVAQMGGSENV